jgi:hypothetical protein
LKEVIGDDGKVMVQFGIPTAFSEADSDGFLAAVVLLLLLDGVKNCTTG